MRVASASTRCGSHVRKPSERNEPHRSHCSRLLHTTKPDSESSVLPCHIRGCCSYFPPLLAHGSECLCPVRVSLFLFPAVLGQLIPVVRQIMSYLSFRHGASVLATAPSSSIPSRYIVLVSLTLVMILLEVFKTREAEVVASYISISTILHNQVSKPPFE